jgi:hypothetical protein
MGGHQEGIADDEVDEAGATMWGRVTYEMMEVYWPKVARGDVVDAQGLPVEQHPPHRRRPAPGRAEAQGRDPGGRGPL